MNKKLRGFWIIVNKPTLKLRKLWKVFAAWFLVLFLLSLALLKIGYTSSNTLPILPYEATDGSSTLRNVLSTSYSSDDADRYDILINSYQRSGSSFLGQLLTSHSDTFYWYEPVWYMHGLFYMMGSFACVGNNNCGDFGTTRIDEVHQQLHNIYSCNFTDLSQLVAENMTEIYSESSWTPYIKCRASNKSIPTCLEVMEYVCRRSKHRATKIVRLTVDNLEHILENNPKVKVIHLLRDPRAIMNSRITTKWYQMNDSVQYDLELIEKNSLELCTRMKYDLNKGDILKEKYPDRFAFVMFEDLIEKVKLNTEILFSYFGMELTSAVTDVPGILQGDHKVNRTKGDYSNWWRFQLNFNTVKRIDKSCDIVFTLLGYKIFENEADLRNISQKAFSFRENMLTKNLNKYDPYDFNKVRINRAYMKKIDVIPKHGIKITDHKTLFI